MATMMIFSGSCLGATKHPRAPHGHLISAKVEGEDAGGLLNCTFVCPLCGVFVSVGGVMKRQVDRSRLIDGAGHVAHALYASTRYRVDAYAFALGAPRDIAPEWRPAVEANQRAMLEAPIRYPEYAVPANPPGCTCSVETIRMKKARGQTYGHDLTCSLRVESNARGIVPDGVDAPERPRMPRRQLPLSALVRITYSEED